MHIDCVLRTRKLRNPFMVRADVTSSELRSVGYSEDDRVLEVEFRSGGIYQYFGVAAELHKGLLSAASVGRFFNEWIREKHFYQRIG
jgi:hypothetical protein